MLKIILKKVIFMNNKGKLIFSTKSSFAVRKAVIGVCELIFIIMAIIMIVNYEGIKSAFGGGSTGGIIAVVAILFFILYPLIMFVMLCLKSASYCEVYENYIVGKTLSLQEFEIPMNEVINVSEEKMTLIIYSQYTNYKVMANTNRAEALREIRSRIGK
jgi:hypothetical protein